MPCHAARRHIVRSVSIDMTGAAKCRDTGDVVGVGIVAQGWLMVRFQASGPPALGAPPAVAGEGGAAGRFPSAGVQTGVVPAHSGELRRPWRDRLPSGAVRIRVSGENQASWEVRPELPYALPNLIKLFFCDRKVLVSRGGQEGRFSRVIKASL